MLSTIDYFMPTQMPAQEWRVESSKHSKSSKSPNPLFSPRPLRDRSTASCMSACPDTDTRPAAKQAGRNDFKV